MLTAAIASCSAAAVVQVAGGCDYALALNSDGTVWAWGDNSAGQLGNGSTAYTSSPVQVSGLSDVTAVSAGYSSGMALKADGTVWAWGSNAAGQLGDGTTTQRLLPVQVLGIANVVAISAGGGHAVALTGNGEVWAWGYNCWGEIGDGTTTTRLVPCRVPGLSGVTSIAAGESHTAALRNDGTVWTWGYNGWGELGDGTTRDKHSPMRVAGLANIVAIAASGSDNAALTADGHVWAWGDGSEGQTGDGTDPSRTLSPIQVAGIDNAMTVAIGEEYMVALRSDHTVWAWGANCDGQLGGAASTYCTPTPVQIQGLNSIASISAGSYSAYALKSDGTVLAWGDNSKGQLCDGTATHRLLPFHIPNLSAVTAISAGLDHVMVQKSDSTIWAWGGGNCGQIGDGTSHDRPHPVQITALPNVKAVAAGWIYSVAVKSDGTAWAWGDDQYGQLGDQRYLGQSRTPVQVPEVSGLTAVSAGAYHATAVKSDGTVWEWGALDPYSPALPAQVAGLTGVKSVAAGYSHSVAVKSDGTVWSWGSDYEGELGDGNTHTFSSTPVQTQGLSGFTAVAAGNCFTVALKSDGTVWSWGNNENGQLGDGTYTARSTPVQVVGIANAFAIAAGAFHAVAAVKGGSVYTWGYNGNGQLGNGTTDDSPLPVVVPDLTGATAIATGYRFTIAKRSDSTLWSWGDNSHGQLGDGHLVHNPQPGQIVGLDSPRPTGTIAFANGSGSTSSSTVTLHLSASVTGATVTQMRISNDGVFDTEPLEPYTSSKVWTLTSGDGTKSVFVRFRSSSDTESNTATATIMLDSTPPLISVDVSPTIAAAGDPVRVVVDATDPSGVSSVTITGVGLTKTGATTWAGDLTAAATPGVQSIVVSATDLLGNSGSAIDNYKTAVVVGTSGANGVIPAATSNWLFRIWGTVTDIVADGFYLDTGSGSAVHVIAPGCSGIEKDSYVSIRGILDARVSPRTLTARPQDLVRYK